MIKGRGVLLDRERIRDIIFMMEEMDYVIGRVCRAVEILEKSREFGYIIPEVGTNIAFSI